ncbi:RNA polymerase sigma factor (sigma-70 family) [Neorhizobium sp. JUb45]|nr:RNA polymerase sigma factor (sigma-70 family) [Neorhizobium sp. JUb45]
MDRDIARLDAIFPGMRPSLVRFILRIVRDVAVAEELTHDAYLRTRKALETSQPRHLEALLWQTARNLALDHIRWKKVRSGTEPLDEGVTGEQTYADPQPSAEDHAIQKDQLRVVGDALRTLPPRAQKVWVLSRVEGWPYPRIAAHLGVSPNTVFNDIKMVMALLLELRKKMDAE